MVIKFNILGAQRCKQNLILVHNDPTPLLSLYMKLKWIVIYNILHKAPFKLYSDNGKICVS